MKNNFKGFLSIALSIIMVLTMMPVMTFAADETTNVAAIGETEYATFKEAITAANVEGATVTLLKDVTLGEKLTINKNITIAGDYAITRADTYTGALFTVNAGATLTLDGGLVIDGNNDWTFNAAKYEEDLKNNVSVATGFNDYVIPETGAPIATAAMFTVYGAVVMNDATIQNHVGNANQRVFYVNGTKDLPGALTMNSGATITHCATAGKGTAAWLEVGNLTMEDGAKITNNYGSQHAALINIMGGSTFTMNGGEISGNRGAASNGSAIMIKTGTFTMNGGKITDNSSVVGNGGTLNPLVYVYNSASNVYINGGEISNNTGTITGGILMREKGGKLVITGGSFINNTSFDYDGKYNDIYCEYENGVTISGGTFTQDVSAWVTDDSKIAYNEETGAYEVKERIAAMLVVNGEAIEFKTLAEALEAANKAAAGDYTITLLEDNAEEFTFAQKQDVNITIDGDGKKFIGKLTVKLSGAVFVIIDTIYNFNDVTYICEDGNTLDFVYVTSTCDTAGYSYYECKECGKKLSEVKYQPLGHYYDEGSVVITEATCAKEGCKQVFCLRCGEDDKSKMEIYEKKSHVYLLLSSAVLPSCTENGHMDLYYCVNCGQHIGGEVIPALGHVEGEDGKCMLCGALQYEDKFCTCGCHATGIKKLFFKLKLVFEKLAKKNTECECGAVHYTLKEEPTFFDRLIAAIKKVEEDEKNNQEEPDLI